MKAGTAAATTMWWPRLCQAKQEGHGPGAGARRT